MAEKEERPSATRPSQPEHESSKTETSRKFELNGNGGPDHDSLIDSIHSNGAAPGKLPPPVITVETGERPYIIDLAENAILEEFWRWGLFRHGELLTRISAWSIDDAKRAEKHDGSVVQRPVGAP